MEDVFTLRSGAFPQGTRVVAFRGREEVSRLYAFEIHLQVPAEDAKTFDLAKAAGATATLSSHADFHAPFAFSGIFTQVEIVQAWGEYALFRAVIAPRLARLRLTEHSRLFTDKSIPDIIRVVLEENGLASVDYELQLSGSYAPEEHVCQYHESDFDFISRWMEHLGIYYWFEQGDSAEKLVITDSKASQTDLPSAPVRYVPTLVDRSARAALETFRARAVTLPATVKLKDYDYAKPTLDISASAAVASNGVGEISVYASRVFNPGDAQKAAQIRAEELSSRQVEHFGGGSAYLRAGYQFTLEEHMMDALNQKYLAIACEHFGNLVGESPDLARKLEVPYNQPYHCDVTAIPATVQFRPKRETHAPRIYGLEHGLIDGEAESDYAQIDAQGRYKVKFFFDESPLSDGKASTWVRQMQPHGGDVEGFHFPLRKGTEVVLSFLGGDPDRPVIAGVVNTATTPSAVTATNHSRNVIQTGGRNRIELEDQDGIQKISVSTPTADTFLKMGATDGGHELTLHTAANSLLKTDANSDIVVGAALTEKVTGPVDETYSATQTTAVAGAQKKDVGSRVLNVHGGHVETNTGAYIQTCNAGSTRTVVGAETKIVNGPTIVMNNGPVVQTTAATYTHNVAAAYTHNVAGPVDVKWGPVTFKQDAHVGVTYGLTSDTFIGLQNSNFIGGKLSMNAAVSIDVTVGASISAFAGVKSSTTLSAESNLNIAAVLSYVAGVKHETNTAIDANEAPLKKIDCGKFALTAGWDVSITASNIYLTAPGCATVNGNFIRVG